MASVFLRLLWLAVAFGGLCGWKFVLDGPTHRTRENLEKQYQVVESYRLTYGKLPSPDEYLAYKKMLIPDLATRHRMSTDGWGRRHVDLSSRPDTRSCARSGRTESMTAEASTT